MKFQWRYSLQNNVPWLIMAMIVTIDLPFDHGLHLMFPFLVIIISLLWLIYYLAFQRPYLTQHPQDKESNRHLNGWGMAVTTFMIIINISILLSFMKASDSPDNLLRLMLWLMFVTQIIRNLFAFPKTAK